MQKDIKDKGGSHLKTCVGGVGVGNYQIVSSVTACVWHHHLHRQERDHTAAAVQTPVRGHAGCPLASAPDTGRC